MTVSEQRAALHQAIDWLPESTFAELARFIEFLQFKRTEDAPTNGISQPSESGEKPLHSTNQSQAIIPFEDLDLQTSENSSLTLSGLLGHYLGQPDLYATTNPVSGPRFFGREKLLSQLTDHIHQGKFLGIYGLRKMGKTSLLYQLRDEKLQGEAVAYVDLQATGALDTRNCAPLYWELERDLYLRLHKKHANVAQILRLGREEHFTDLPDKGAQARLFFKEDIRSFLDALIDGKLKGVHRLVIVLDELEKILPLAGQPKIEGYLEFFGLLRGLAQTERYRGLLSSVVVAANAAIIEKGYLEDRENPVFAYYKSVFLPPLEENECAEMIRELGKQMSVYWQEEAMQAIFTETNGHPFLTRLLCSDIVQTHQTRPLKVTEKMVQEQIIPFLRKEADKLEQIIELLKTHFPQEKTLLEQIALDEAPPTIPDQALSHLLGYHLVTPNGGNYKVTLNLLRRQLRRRAGIRE